MKLITFEADGRRSYGAVTDGGIVDLGARLGREAPALIDLIAGDLATRAETIAAGAAADCALESVRLERPVPAPSKILCVGINYLDRNAEYRDGTEQPKNPSVFVRFPASFVAHGQALIRPPETKQFDYEGEIALVIGKRGRRIARERAMGHVFGYTVANEGTAREWTRHGKFNVTQGKNFDRSGSIGPWIVTADAAPAGPLRVKTRVNGEERQNDTTDRLLFPFDFLISYLSIFTTLEPGDMILTGTPNGAGARFNPPKWLVPGDVVEVEVEGIGVLSNPVEDETV
ncbi:MAG TPA: fumarylacetoacetate hydrolase family protein [Hyphomicrobiaceae bacterium]|jgi:2-keto-4-pentenoate hydratase/2-oxohepta-3-ene-1,7-dioic acid hydratase in catechol pathway|nr:fumarylacetoacetate hydrolase family protein [Hyphomicrobiaceae bacterium]